MSYSNNTSEQMSHYNTNINPKPCNYGCNTGYTGIL
jgi:hypothetical protein